jgi:hypothetical protein
MLMLAWALLLAHQACLHLLLLLLLHARSLSLPALLLVLLGSASYWPCCCWSSLLPSSRQAW